MRHSGGVGERRRLKIFISIATVTLARKKGEGAGGAHDVLFFPGGTGMV